MAEIVVVDVEDIPTPGGGGGGEEEPGGTSACATTLGDVIAQTRRLLLTGRREQRNKLTDAISSGAESLTISYAAGAIADGARLSIEFENFYVHAIAGSTVTVEPAFEGTTAADHVAGSAILVNPQYSDFEIRAAVNDVLRDLSSPGSGLFRVAAVDLDYDANTVGYDITGATYVDDLLSVSWMVPSEQNRWTSLRRKYWRFERNADTTAFPSGFGITLLRGLGLNAGSTYRVNYKTRYSFLTAYGDNVEAVSGLHCDAHDLLWIGAALRLTESREVQRTSTFSQGDPRRANEVPAGSQNAAPGGLRDRWQKRLQAEAGRLARQWPTYIR